MTVDRCSGWSTNSSVLEITSVNTSRFSFESQVASSLDDLAAKLARVAERLADAKCVQIKDSKGIYYFAESPLRDGKLAFLFPGEGAQFGGFSLSLSLPTEADAQKAFAALSEGGKVTMPLMKTFWSPCFGMLEDKFGVGWMVTVFAEPVM